MGIVYIPQKDFYFENLTVDENLRIAGNIYSKAELDERIEQVYEQISLSKHKKRKPFNLSGGEKKMLAFGMGLIHKPKLILFDEPLAGVDNKSTNYLLQLFKEVIINNNHCVILVEHKDAARELYSRKITLELGTTKNN